MDLIIILICFLPKVVFGCSNFTGDSIYLPVSGASCSFTNNDTCGYTLNPPWEVFMGASEFYPSPTHAVHLMQSGADDDFYAILRSSRTASHQNFTMSSPIIQSGDYEISFDYAFPASASSLHIDIRTMSGETMGVWYDSTRYRAWKEEHAFLNATSNFQVIFWSEDVRFGFVILDNIRVCTACPKLTIKHGTLRYVLTTAHVICDRGFVIQGYNSTTCLQGAWDFDIGVCVHVDCGNITAPANGSVQLQTTNFKSDAEFSCNPGYYLYGDYSSQCQSNGTWSNILTSCKPKDCGNITAPINGNVNLTSTEFQSMGTFSCNAGYELHDDISTQCQSNGTWSNILTTCRPKHCGNITAPINGNVKFISTEFQSVATFSCIPGYSLHGENSTRCQSNGTWSNALTSCQPKGCGNISAPINGHVHLTYTKFDSVATFSCDSGYQLFGENRTTCMHNGIWKTVTVVCKQRHDTVNLNVAIDAACTSVGWNVLINMSALKISYPTVKPTDIFLGDSSCKGESVDNKLWFRQGFNDCSTVEKTEPNNIVYTNDLIYAIFDTNNPFVIRQHVFTLTVECDVQRTEAASSHVHHETIHQHVNFTIHNNISMAFYKDANFREPISGNPLHAHVGDQVYAKVYTTVPDWNIKLRLHTCYIKPPQTSNSSMNFFLIKDGCETDTNTHIISQSAHETTFVFQDFEYSTNREGLDILCNATFCETTDYSPKCTQRCHSNPIVIG